MRTPTRITTGLAAGVLALLAVGDVVGGGTDASPVSSASVTSTTYTASGPTDHVAPTADPDRTKDTVTVTAVLDGDTFVANGQTVRVFGISSCETSTPGGAAATDLATSMLLGQQVTLRDEPGRDRDAEGRSLRYVDLAHGGDYGDFMVTYAHTGADVTTGAASDYVAQLRADDRNGRNCALAN